MAHSHLSALVRVPWFPVHLALVQSRLELRMLRRALLPVQHPAPTLPPAATNAVVAAAVVAAAHRQADAAKIRVEARRESAGLWIRKQYLQAFQKQ